MKKYLLISALVLAGCDPEAKKAAEADRGLEQHRLTLEFSERERTAHRAEERYRFDEALKLCRDFLSRPQEYPGRLPTNCNIPGMK